MSTAPAEEVATETNDAHELGALIAKLDGETIGVACGVCIYGMEGDDCPMAAEIGGQYYFVTLATGEEFDTHGVGLCDAASTARVTGEVREKGVVLSAIESISDDSVG